MSYIETYKKEYINKAKTVGFILMDTSDDAFYTWKHNIESRYGASPLHDGDLKQIFFEQHNLSLEPGFYL